MLKKICALTIWSLCSTCCYFLIVLLDYALKVKAERTCRVLNMTLFTIEFLVTIFYWTALFPNDAKHFESETLRYEYSNITNHSIPLILLLVESAWNKHLYTKKSILVPIIYGLLYSIVNAVYAFTHDAPVYPCLTWKDWKTPVFAAGATGLLVAGGFTLYYAKNCWTKKMNKKSMSSLSDDSMYNSIA